MSQKKFSLLKNLHLLISLAIVVPFAFIYGLSPAETLPRLFDFTVETTDLTNVFRAIMGLYLGISAVWIMGIVKPHLWKTATTLHIVFMLGLALGRTLSLILDSVPSQPFVTGLILEFGLGVYGILQWRKYANNGT